MLSNEMNKSQNDDRTPRKRKNDESNVETSSLDNERETKKSRN